MLKKKRNINLIATIALVVGLVLVIIGLIFGASTSFYIDARGVHIEENGKHYEVEKKIGEIEDLDIDVSFTEVEIKTSDKNMVVATGTKKSDQPFVEVRNKKLYIGSSKHKGFFIGMFHFPDRHSKITIYLKKDTMLNSTTIDTSFGSVDMNHFQTETLNISSSFGSVTTDTTTKRLTVDSSFGEINTTIKNVEKINISSSFGEINLDVFGSKGDYRIQTDSSFGEINTDDNGGVSTGTRIGTITLDNSFGDINLRFLK